ncbi:hypothetical protein [Tropicimonas marinistellae]|uniref:hypothetical protein n=1 Tax=Tropicimonas marinistellae TaxID=1739787 RepID=UPI00122E1605|nr:hypothetical protein [Tropicimonas marinistellae]
MKILASIAAAALLASTGFVFAEGNAVGQDPLTLATTKCGNNGGGNDAEVLLRTKDGLKCIKNVKLRRGEDNYCDVDPGGSGPISIGKPPRIKCYKPKPAP